jgi:hypothetical protein
MTTGNTTPQFAIFFKKGSEQNQALMEGLGEIKQVGDTRAHILCQMLSEAYGLTLNQFYKKNKFKSHGDPACIFINALDDMGISGSRIIDEKLLAKITDIELESLQRLASVSPTSPDGDATYSVSERVKAIVGHVNAISSALGEEGSLTPQDAKALLQATQQMIGMVEKNL